MKRLAILGLLLIVVFRRQLCSFVSMVVDFISRVPSLFSKGWLVFLRTWQSGVPAKVLLCFAFVAFWLLFFRKLVCWICAKFASGEELPKAGDEPICREEDDCLGRVGYILTLIKLMQAGDKRESQVIGIYGAWGEGKSSVIKILKDVCKKRRIKSFSFVDFNPWYSVVRKDLNADLLKKIGCAMRWRNPGLALLLLQYACQKTVYFIPDFNGLLQFAAVMFAKICNIMCDLESVKRAIVAKMPCCNKRVVVIVDDVDRLTQDETRELVRCIKTNGDIPNVTYMVLADERLLARMVASDYLDDDGGGVSDKEKIGRTYLEKIISYPMPLWPISKSLLRNELQSLTTNILHRYGFESGEVCAECFDFVIEKCETLRTVKRLSRVFDFALAYYMEMTNSHGTDLNINLADAFCLSAVRMVCPEAIKLIYHKYWDWVKFDIVKTVDSYAIDEAEYNEFIGEIPAEHQAWIRQFMKSTLMLSESNATTGGGMVYEPIAAKDSFGKIARQFRLASPHHFHRYFSYQEIPRDAVPRGHAIEFFRKTKTKDKFKEFLTSECKLYGAINFIEQVRESLVPTTYSDPLAVAMATDWMMTSSRRLTNTVAEASVFLDSAGMNFVEFLERSKSSGGNFRDGCEHDICEYIKANKAYSLAAYWVGFGVGQLEPRDRFSSQPLKIDVGVALDLWEWLRAALYGKMFDDKIAIRGDAESIQRHFNWLVMFRCPTDGDTYAGHIDYLLRSMDNVACMGRLKTLGRYATNLSNGDIELDFGLYNMKNQKNYISILVAAEKAFIKYADEMSDEDCVIYSEASKGIQTPGMKKAEEIVKSHTNVKI